MPGRPDESGVPSRRGGTRFPGAVRRTWARIAGIVARTGAVRGSTGARPWSRAADGRERGEDCGAGGDQSAARTAPVAVAGAQGCPDREGGDDAGHGIRAAVGPVEAPSPAANGGDLVGAARTGGPAVRPVRIMHRSGRALLHRHGRCEALHGEPPDPAADVEGMLTGEAAPTGPARRGRAARVPVAAIDDPALPEVPAEPAAGSTAPPAGGKPRRPVRAVPGNPAPADLCTRHDHGNTFCPPPPPDRATPGVPAAHEVSGSVGVPLEEQEFKWVVHSGDRWARRGIPAEADGSPAPWR
ncbi:hypothetical protein SUDANB6_05679 [Streptomyces sp. enrichment culture]